MDDDWKEWGVVETIRPTKIPGFMAPPGMGMELLEKTRQVVRKQWDEFIELLNADGPGTGYRRLLTLRDNMEARKEELSSVVEEWEDREDWLRRLKGVYVNKLQRLAGVSNPEALWRTHGVTDPIEQLDSAHELPADQPIADTFLDFDDDGRLEEEPDLEHGWKAHIGNIPIDSSLQNFVHEKSTDRTEPFREDMAVRYQFSEKELERVGIDPDNLEFARSAIKIKPSTSWRDALQQIEEKEESIREKKESPERTIRVLDFRLRILENVLYRFETFGSVSTLTEQEAKQYASEDTPTADDIMAAFEESGLDECEDWEEKDDLKNWAVRAVDPTPSPSTVERRLQNIEVWVKGKQGVPGSGLQATIQKMKAYVEAD